VGAIPDYDGALAQALAAAPGTSIPLAVRIDYARLFPYVARSDRRYSIAARNSRVKLRGIRPFVTRSRAGYGISARDLRRAIVSTVRAHERSAIEVPYTRVRPAVTRRNIGPVIVIRRESKKLVLYKGMRKRTVFGVATGQAQYPTPLGSYRIVTKQRHPWWYPPNSDWARGASPIPPGPGNPLGTRWMGLSWGGVGIHGTPDAASIGYSASHGCIRMRIPEAEWLFERVRIGTKVFVVSA
jgi:lipoprotein-anchoring transpeptidase ErfK/SrfK